MKETLAIGLVGVAISVIGYLSHNSIVQLVSVGVLGVFMGKMIKEMLTCPQSEKSKEATKNSEYYSSPK